MTPGRTLIRWVAAVLLVLYSLVIARLTLMPARAEHGVLAILDKVTRLSNGRLTWDQTEQLANIALFVPAGLLAAVVLGRTWAAIVLCVLASIGIELAQQHFLSSRVPTAVDVRNNGLGGVIGAVVAWPLAHYVRRPRRPPTYSNSRDEATRVLERR